MRSHSRVVWADLAHRAVKQAVVSTPRWCSSIGFLCVSSGLLPKHFLRKYIGSRAKKSDTARIREGEALLAPLTTVLKQMAATAAARATKRKHAEPSEGSGTNSSP